MPMRKEDGNWRNCGLRAGLAAKKKLRGSVYSHGASVGPRVSGVRRAKRARADWRSAR